MGGPAGDGAGDGASAHLTVAALTTDDIEPVRNGKSSCRLSPGPAAHSAAPPGPGSVAAPAVAASAFAPT
eukprot:scaffold43499_cov72-Phaeocystis_antarctica.AAC.3